MLLRYLRDRPVRQKITFVIMTIAGVVLLLALAGLFCFQAYTLKQRSAHELAVVADITAHNCAAAVMFKDEGAAAQMLSGLKTMPQIVSARLELANEQRLASFGTARDEEEIRAARLKSGFRVEGDRILLAQPVVVNGKREATLYLLTDLHATTSQLLKLYAGIFTLFLIASLVVAFVLSSQFLRFVTDPILRLARIARTVADHNDYSVRATKICNDEVGVLTDAFNQMLAQIQRQDTELRRAEERYRGIFENAVVGIYQTTLEGHYLAANRAEARILGYDSVEELIASSFDLSRSCYVEPERRSEFIRLIEEHGAVSRFESAIWKNDGTIVWISEEARALRDADGKLIGFEGMNIDITEQKRAEEALRESESKLTLAQHIARLGYWERDLLNERITWSDETYRVFGLSPDAKVDTFACFEELLHPEDRQRVGGAIAAAMDGGPRYDIEYRVVWPNDEVRFVHSQGDVIRDDTGRPQRMFGTVQDITQRKQAEEALRQAEEKYRTIFENAVLGMYQTTPDGKYVSINRALARICGYDSPAELVQNVTNVSALYVDAARRAEFKHIVESKGFVEAFECEVYRKDRTRIWLSENARAVRDGDGRVRYYEGTVQDITQRKRVDELERVSKAKSEFLSRMSHELRTPLNAILGFGQLLEKQELTDKQRTRVRHILTAGKHLLDLINEILDISRIEAGRLQLSLEPVGIADAVREAFELMRPLAAEHAITLLAPAPPDVDMHVLADRQRLKQVLLNLLTNAVKYTPRGGNVTICFEPSEAGRARISVRDTGPGIPTDKISRLFTAFDRLGAEQSAVEGTGLGLALSQRLMQAMAGSIGVDSTPGRGSTFWVELPCTGSPLERVSLASASGSGTQLSTHPRSILYVEDNLSNLSLIEQMLAEEPQVTLITAMQGRLALDLARQHSPDLILLDLHLPDMPGWEVLAQLQRHESTRHIPVVIVSADATSRQIKRLLEAGARAYLTKPIDMAEFFRVIDSEELRGSSRSTATVAVDGNGNGHGALV